MAHIDFKITIWERVIIDDDKVPDLINRIKDGSVMSSSDLFEVFDDECHYEGILYDTSDQMTVEENDNQSTIEVYEKNEMVFSNDEK
jgi:hypothetical protein